MKQAIFTADDFGLSEAVNDGIEQAHRDGVLTSASLMVAGAAVDDAVRRAKRNPGLRVGLHLVVIEGPAVLPPREIGKLVDARGQFSSNQLSLGLRYCFSPRARRQLATEIRAQFSAFQATGLTLDHADAHKHMHLHPVIGGLLVKVGREFGLRAIRIPAEPPEVMARLQAPVGRALYRWSALLRRQARRSGMVVNDAAFGIAWSGHITEQRLLRLIPLLPDGLNEIYFHPAASRDRIIDALMPDYEHEAELAALCSPAVRAALGQHGIALVGYGDLPETRSTATP